MRETLTYGTVCSGIGCAELAASQFGWQPVFCSEIEDFPSEVMAVPVMIWILFRLDCHLKGAPCDPPE